MFPHEAKYGTITTEKGSFHDDEPVFLFRAADKLALDRLREYAAKCLLAGCAMSHVQSIMDRIKAFETWQWMNPELVKLPD